MMAKNYRGRYSKAPAPKHFHLRKVLTLVMAVAALSAATIGGTLAYISTKSDEPLVNTFEAADVSCNVTESFNGRTKENVAVKNTSDVPVYIRVKLVPYWFDREEDIVVAKEAWKPTVATDTNWVLASDGFYYYTQKVSANASTPNLIHTQEMKVDPVSLSRPVLEIVASCIQAEPGSAVTKAWDSGVSAVNTDGSLTIKTGTGG